MADLSRLSGIERRILLLLAAGHTAKSAATALGITEGAVNERLREARRKAGVGSSRELARLASQENRDEKIGVAQAAGPGDTVLAIRARWPLLLGVSSMIVLAAAVGAVAALAVAGHPAPAAPPAAAAPRVVDVHPAMNAEAPAGKIVIKVTFDQPMRPGGYSFIARDRATYPNCARTPTQSKDGRTFALDCTVEAGKTYWIGFNNARFQNFQSVSGVPAVPALLQFSVH